MDKCVYIFTIYLFRQFPRTCTRSKRGDEDVYHYKLLVIDTQSVTYSSNVRQRVRRVVGSLRR